MSGLLKRTLTSVIYPVAAAADALQQPCARIWAHAKLRARIGRPIDPSVVVLGLPEIHGTGNIELGKDLYLYRELYWETQDSGAIRVGDGVVMSRGVHLVSFASIEIGAGAMIGEYASIRDANHRFGDGRSVRHTGHESAPVIIDQNAWIARGVTVLPGVTIGAGAVVGANAVVTKDVAPGEVVAGVPARALGKAA